MARATETLIEPLGANLVALAQCYALDATVFPHASIPLGSAATVFVARASTEGPIIGFAATQRVGARLEITGIAVELSHRRSGVGRALLRAVALDARERGFGEIALHVAVDNARAVRLYDAEGFGVTRRLAGYYRSSDAYEMVKRLR